MKLKEVLQRMLPGFAEEKYTSWPESRRRQIHAGLLEWWRRWRPGGLLCGNGPPWRPPVERYLAVRFQISGHYCFSRISVW